ncbi:MAG: ATP-binding protein [Bacteroidetes bacterium]|nr:MAG: ATP-binding protein [Bacteroidota bacterium]
MLFIRSFPCKLDQTEQLAQWLQEVATALEVISYNRLRFVIHEAFVNACKYSDNPDNSIIVMIRRKENIEIVVTDTGRGFAIPEMLSRFDQKAIGQTWKLAVDRDTMVRAKLEAPHTIGFYLESEEMAQLEPELKENHRGLISILKTAKNLSYHFVPNSFNYLQITC